MSKKHPALHKRPRHASSNSESSNDVTANAPHESFASIFSGLSLAEVVREPRPLVAQTLRQLGNETERVAHLASEWFTRLADDLERSTSRSQEGSREPAATGERVEGEKMTQAHAAE